MNRTQYSVKLGAVSTQTAPPPMQPARDAVARTAPAFLFKKSFVDVQAGPVVGEDLARTGVAHPLAI